MGDGNCGAKRPSWRNRGLYRKAEQSTIEELCPHVPNVIRFQMLTGRRRWHILGCYISPRDASNIEDIVAAIRVWPYRAQLLVAGNLNANLEDTERRPKAIVDRLTAAGMMDTGLHFPPWCKMWLKERCTSRMQRDGQEVRSQMDYILGTYCIFFQEMAVQDTRHHSTII